MKVAIVAARRQTRQTYGEVRLQPELQAQGFVAGRDRIARLRQELTLRCKQTRKFTATTNSNHDLPAAPNLLGQVFKPVAPNTVWVTDITYIATSERWLRCRHQRCSVAALHQAQDKVVELVCELKRLTDTARATLTRILVSDPRLLAQLLDIIGSARRRPLSSPGSLRLAYAHPGLDR
ncbi:IS3 family transposase [Massilia sp. CCM 8692]|uniref:IS3 family transposase n=1 Tax=Massilia rubra TaxID=2607910 RepID=A0ABX0LU40_9BURK|nr:IS3 family transposase [Massilia rubra]